MNVLCVTGNLGRDAEVRQAGKSTVCSFSVAMTAGYGDKKQTIWLDCSLWGKQAEGALPSYLTKGQQVALTGELSTREHEGKTYLQLRVSTIDLIGKREDSGQAPAAPVRQQAAAPSPAAPAADAFDDDIPFAPIGLQEGRNFLHMI